MNNQDPGLNNKEVLSSLITTYFNSPTSKVIVDVRDIICDYEFYEEPMTVNQMKQFFDEIVDKGKHIFYVQQPTGRLIKVNIDGREILVQLNITPMF